MSWRLFAVCTVMAAIVSACVVRTSGEAGAGGPPAATPAATPVAAEGPAEGAVPPAEGTALPPGATVQDITDETGHVYHVAQGARGEPGQVGCADGQREAFVDAAAFPRIAGCLGKWEGKKSMRDPSTRRPCGDDGGACMVPADLCAPGWRVCGSGGAIADLTQVSGAQCEHAGGGRFSAGLSHCETQSGCVYDNQRANGDYDCFKNGWCSETVCCGSDCGDFGACVDGIWPGKTHIAQGQDQGCGATTSRHAGGVLCCR